MTSDHHHNASAGRGRRSPRPIYVPPANPAGPEAAALDLITQFSDAILKRVDDDVRAVFRPLATVLDDLAFGG